MCSVYSGSGLVVKIRERGYKKKILQLYCNQLSYESCAIKTYRDLLLRLNNTIFLSKRNINLKKRNIAFVGSFVLT
jgi:hypothetical protein